MNSHCREFLTTWYHQIQDTSEVRDQHVFYFHNMTGSAFLIVTKMLVDATMHPLTLICMYMKGDFNIFA